MTGQAKAAVAYAVATGVLESIEGRGRRAAALGRRAQLFRGRLGSSRALRRHQQLMATRRSANRNQATVKWSRRSVHRFLIVLAETKPRVWRRIQVPIRYSFWDLHVAIQDAMGWLDYHLHEFEVRQSKGSAIKGFGIPGNDVIDAQPCHPTGRSRSDHVRLGMPPIHYLYDFGDDWRHVVTYRGAGRSRFWSDVSSLHRWCEEVPAGGLRRCPWVRRLSCGHRQPEACGAHDASRVGRREVRP